MQFTYENQGTNTYLCCDLTDMEIDTMGLGMITNNRIPGFVHSIFTQIDDRKLIKYNVSSRVSIKQFFSGQVNRKRLVNVFAGIAEVLTVSEEYMLDMNSILLDTDYIFIDVTSYSAEVIYVPAVMENGGNMEAALFFKNIMFTTQFDSSENCDYVAEIINFLNQRGTFSIWQFRQMLDRLKRGPEPEVKAPAVEKPEPVKPGRTAAVREKPVTSVQEESGEKKKPEEPDRKPLREYEIPKTDSGKKEVHAEQAPEKEISLFYLLQHYNKENADAYKAQREARKQKTGTSSEKEPKKEKGKKEKTQEKKSPEAPVTFAVPGQQRPLPVGAQADAASVPPASAPVQKASQAASAPVNETASAPSGQSRSDFGETEYLNQGNDGGTVLMGTEGTQNMQPYLLRLKNNERIPLDREVLRIGRDKENVDYSIPENKFVGHNHCHILARNGEYFLVDDNSKNHTYVNGTMIQSNVEIKLSHGVIVSVANEEFEFRLF
ncbi:MAG: FHA domain-containing protein [Lachnospiraceae bacterium]|nr:FHA domain-containing protein [Lachnospiraceae bacterium]MCI9143767.1 FHA domain-containing protein [Lachnospiraceae bacterium]